MRQLGAVEVTSGIGPLSLDGQRVLFPLARRAGQDWDSVAVWALGAGSYRVVSTSRWPHGLINWVAGAGGWVAWSEQSRRQSDARPNVLWRITALNLSTGQRRVLATNGSAPDPFVPQVHGKGRYLFWTQPDTGRTAQELVWTDSWSRPRAVLRHTELTPGSETAANGQLVYLGRASGDHRGHTVGGDCWTAPLDGSSPPRPLTRTALAMGCAVSDAHELVWTEHIDPHARPLPADGLLDDPYQVQTAHISGPSPWQRRDCCTAATSPWATPSSETGSPRGPTTATTPRCMR